MPKVKAPEPLLNLCLESIYFSIETSLMWLSEDEPDDSSVIAPRNQQTGAIWIVSSEMKNADVESMIDRKELNPFHQLPTILLEEIINHYIKFEYLRLGMAKPIKNKILEYFITPQLKRLRFLFYSEKYLELFPNFGAVELLDFTFSEAGDNCLKIIGINCKKLWSLNINGCNQVTDIGIQWLCVGGDPVDAKCGIQNEICKTLHRLVMLGTGATKKGVHFALQNLFVLESLENEMIFEVLAECWDAAFDQFMSDNSNLFSFRKNFSLFRSNILGQVITQLCPSFHELWISEKELKNPDLLPFVSHLKKFRMFSLMSYDTSDVQEITFHLVPILEVIGKSLKIIDVSNVDIWVIIKLCPNLTELFFDNNSGSISVTSFKTKGETDYFQIMDKNQLTLRKLKTLYCQNDASPEFLNFFLSPSCPLLVNLYFSSCTFVTDDFLKETSSLQKIKDLRFASCDMITIQGLNALMIDQSSLKYLTFECCKNVTLNDVYNLKALVDRKNWDLRFYYTNFESHIFTSSEINAINRY